MAKAARTGARSRARELIVQSLYQMQIAGHSESELLTQFRDRPDYERVDGQHANANRHAVFAMNCSKSVMVMQCFAPTVSARKS